MVDTICSWISFFSSLMSGYHQLLWPPLWTCYQWHKIGSWKLIWGKFSWSSVFWEDCIGEASEKRAKYIELVEEYWSYGWSVMWKPIYFECKEFKDQSLCRTCNILGITGSNMQRDINWQLRQQKVAVNQERRLRWICAIWIQVGTQSTLVGSPGWDGVWFLKLKAPNIPRRHH